MSNSGFTITLNSQQVQDALNDLAGRLDNLKPAMEDIGRALQFSALQKQVANVDNPGGHRNKSNDKKH